MGHHARTDGRTARVVAHPAMTPDGIALSPDGRAPYLTLSGSGRLIAIDDWPLPELRQHFNALRPWRPRSTDPAPAAGRR